MTSEKSDNQVTEDPNLASQKPEAPVTEPPSNSATTPDKPEFGWSNYAERVNGRFAMIGFLAVLLVEAFSHSSFLKWVGLVQ